MENMKTSLKVYRLNFAGILFLNDDPGYEYQRPESFKAGRKFKILIIDAEPIISEMYKIKLEKYGYEVFAANDGRTGVSLARKIKPDIILADILMPERAGSFLLGKLKNDPKLKNIPVIASSNEDDADCRKKVADLGAVHFLVKPDFLPREAADIIKKVLLEQVDNSSGRD